MEIVLKPATKFVTGPAVRTRYGGKSAAWLWRIIRNEKDFPSPLVLGGRYFFPLEELDAFDAKHRRSELSPPDERTKAQAPTGGNQWRK